MKRLIPVPDIYTVDYLLNIDDNHFEQLVDRIYSAKFQLNKADFSDTDAPLYLFEFTNTKWYSYSNRGLVDWQENATALDLPIHFAVLKGLSGCKSPSCKVSVEESISKKRRNTLEF